MYNWSSRSANNLQTCHDDLQVLANAVLEVHDCTVVYGHRTEEEQNELFEDGLSKLQFPESRHNAYPSEAIDLAPYVPGQDAYDKEYSYYFAGLVLGIADSLYNQGKMAYRVRWGGNWSTQRDRSFKRTRFYDGLHFELVM